ncbi:hypothetical protein DY000_02060967 [Brassica cretica]|uniref:Uncharacterized protein n=1 Tax=Brassica cretica TaxID=69181 RepID=A0ABQ7AN25_BRACR|nr:hypothetical protein DY000_02060967 [Brassica cretica]
MARPRATLESLHVSLESRCGEVKLGFCAGSERFDVAGRSWSRPCVDETIQGDFASNGRSIWRLRSETLNRGCISRVKAGRGRVTLNPTSAFRGCRPREELVAVEDQQSQAHVGG